MTLFREKAEALFRRRSSFGKDSPPAVRREAFDMPGEEVRAEDFSPPSDAAEALSDRLERESRRRARSLD